ncbi:hypothetical protein [Anabaena sp. UHCC 0451]|uniref:hypothetical protein n=1 Tax=Anabaena sp. UHCC 0451 TaxID=2055235 RepID=UPI002B2189C5|nr:hypothetical protein [Anabaena sp. UHCC 0451]MEA5579463.1 hypothetical protein [Anabaena sp. UHCC 0451]
MSHSNAVPIIENLLDKIAYDLVDRDEKITGLIAQTNCDSWAKDDSENLTAWFQGRGKIEFSVTLLLSGDQDDERPFCGSEISVKLKGKASTSNNDNDWRITEYEILNADCTDF